MTKKKPSLTTQDRDRLVHLLATAPITLYEYYRDPESERSLDVSALRTAILDRNGGFEVWREDSCEGMSFDGTYPTIKEARAAESEAARRAVNAINAHMEKELDKEWKNRPACPVKWKFPMVFTDATDYEHGWPLHSKEQVLDFLANQRACIFEPDEPGSIYWWSLRDANGVGCHPVRSHRGEIRLEA